jgi:aminoglycoside phosphotransferase (APT) family kinase protein
VNRPDDAVEGARPVRDEDAFDVEAVASWLRTHADSHARRDLEGTPEVRQFSGGASNLTYLLRYPAGPDLILRRAPRGTKARGAHDMSREFRIQRQLKPVFGYVPEMIGFCADEAVIGADFYVMERIDGVVPRADLSPEALGATQARQLCENMIDVLVELHSVDADAAGLGSLGKGPGYVRRQVDGWSTRCRNAHTDDAPDFDRVMEWLAANQPDDVANCVIHNDFKLDNLVFDRTDPTRVVGVLDWEMATLGDPLMDLGGDLAFWVQADDDDEFQLFRRVPTHLPGMMTREEFVQRYCDRMGFAMTPEQWRFYEIFGLFRLAVISQQIYYRYFHKQTTNEVFAVFGAATQLAAKRIERLLGWR